MEWREAVKQSKAGVAVRSYTPGLFTGPIFVYRRADGHAWRIVCDEVGVYQLAEEVPATTSEAEGHEDWRPL